MSEAAREIWVTIEGGKISYHVIYSCGQPKPTYFVAMYSYLGHDRKNSGGLEMLENIYLKCIEEIGTS
jgi:hypothetical protein